MTVSEIETNPADFADWVGLHALLHAAFAFMTGRIDPPSSLHAMTPEALAAKAGGEDFFLIRAGGRPIGCLFAAVQHDSYYLGKLAVDPAYRGRGLARALVDAAAVRARALGLAALTLSTRVELTENHATFRALGFVQTGATAHPGFDRPTSLTFRRSL